VKLQETAMNTIRLNPVACAAALAILAHVAAFTVALV